MTDEKPIIPLTEWLDTAIDIGVPIAWLAGYPRSGAALIRTILVNCFGQQTGTLYNETNMSAGYAEAMRLLPYRMEGGALMALAKRQGLLTFKTHELPRQNEKVPAIVIVRDGRRMFESLLTFYRERNNRDYAMTELILGKHLWGDWTTWIRAWATCSRRDTQWFRYEDTMADVAGTVDRIAQRWGLTPISHEIPAFDSLHKTEPTIFVAGKMEGNGGMTEEEEDLFWRVHGATMTMMGYQR